MVALVVVQTDAGVRKKVSFKWFDKLIHLMEAVFKPENEEAGGFESRRGAGKLKLNLSQRQDVSAGLRGRLFTLVERGVD
jgi:hypothetical protein